jgi:hypothetical protein
MNSSRVDDGLGKTVRRLYRSRSFMPFHRSPSRAGFSLLEVTLVVVIIFLLILALIPAFRGKHAIQRYPVLPPPPPTTPKIVNKPSAFDIKTRPDAPSEPAVPLPTPLPPAPPGPM